MKQSVADQHSSEMDHDVSFKVVDADKVGNVGDCPQRKGGEVDTNNEVCKSSFSNNLKISPSSQIVMHGINDLKIIEE